MKILCIQHNPIVGDMTGIRADMLAQVKQAALLRADMIVFPELSTIGYSPRDLLLRESVIEENEGTIERIKELTIHCPALTVVIGCCSKTRSYGCRPLYNSAIAIKNGNEIATHHKTLLPNEDVFDEDRYFERGGFTESNFPIIEVAGQKVCMLICEEFWNNKNQPDSRYHTDPVAYATGIGAKLIVGIHASPFRLGVVKKRLEMMRQHCVDNKVKIVNCYQVGANDEIVFDGSSFAMNEEGKVTAWCGSFTEAIMTVHTDTSKTFDDEVVDMDQRDAALAAIILATKNYVGKQGIIGPLLINVSGGIDSALAAYIAACAVGANNVLAFSQPSEFSSEGSKQDAFELCRILGIRYDTIPIAALHSLVRSTINDSIERMRNRNGIDFLSQWIKNPAVQVENSGVTDENIQPRIRGMLVMVWANLLNGLVISTGNKSEMAVGFTTLYGDMAGGLNVLKDVPKTLVFRLCERINEKAGKEIIPWNTIRKPPSAELRPGQEDIQSLPPYPILDEIIRRYADEFQDVNQIIEEMMEQEKHWCSVAGFYAANAPAGFWRQNLTDYVVKACSLIDGAEFKRRQAPLGPKITSKDLARGRQVPVVQGWTREWKKSIK